MADSLSLVMMTFPQRWDGNGTLTLNLTLLPSVDPISGPLIGSNPATPSFANGKPVLAVHVQPTVAALPSLAAPGVFEVTPTVTSDPADPPATFKLLQTAVVAAGRTVGAPATLPPVTARIRKSLPPSYLAAGGGPPTGDLTTTDADFGCDVRGEPAVPLTPPPTTISWGEIISYAMRQPVLATKLGIQYSLQITLPAAQASALAGGGWVWVSLDATDPWSSAGALVSGSIRVHAARIPPLDGAARSLFASNEFVVDGTATPPDSAFAAAEEYADGFAKLVHCTQPDNTDAAVGDGELAPASDVGIQIGWDDEQVVTWHNDQLSLLNARRAGTLSAAPAAPLGVLGYRVDVADVTPATPGGPPLAPAWQSLARVTTTVASLGTFTGELSVEPTSTRPSNPAINDAWLPRYFANWRGGSLCAPDTTPQAMTTGTTPAPPTRTADGLTTLLSYGHLYAFRVRLSDLSNGGPDTADAAVDPAPNATALQTFQRFVPPKAPIVVQDPLPTGTGPALGTPTTLTISRPLIGYPEVLYTALGDSAAARDDVRTALVSAAATQVAAVKANPTTTPISIAGLPDPDVDSVEVEVRVRHPLHDGSGATYQTLYHATRTLNPVTGTAPLGTDPGTTVPVAYIDAPTIEGWAAQQATSGPLLIPRGRDVQIKIRAGLRPDSTSYFAPEATPTMATTIGVRTEPTGEPALLERADALEPVAGYLFRRPPNVAAPGLVQQLGELLGVASNGNSLASPPGQRTIFGASKGLRHTISADGETLTFGSTTDLLGQWVVAITLDLERDWTWDGLQDAGFIVLRGGPTDTEATNPPSVGAITVPRVIGAAANTNPTEAARSRTRLIFLDAIDPHEPVPDSGFPESLQHRWFVNPVLRPAGPPLDPSAPAPLLGPSPLPPVTGTELASTPLDLRLPIAIPPSQVPAIASVGLAQSPFVAGHGYASTEQRQRALWIELTEPIDNSVGDALFARVLAHGADPLLYDATPALAAAINDPPLPLDPELVRFVIPADTDDRAGINAMTQLIPSSTSPGHFLLPLPPGSDADDPELFGFYSYELRVGHAGPIGDLRWWSTANGRFGSPLRVVGVQHPAPPLACHAGRYTYPPTVSTSNLITQLRASTVPFPLEAIIAASGGTAAAAGTGGSSAAASGATAAASSGGVAAVTSSAAAGAAAASTSAVAAAASGIRVVSTATTARPPLAAVVPLTSPAAIAATPIRGIGSLITPAQPASPPPAQTAPPPQPGAAGATSVVAAAPAFDPGLLAGFKVVPAEPSLIVVTAPYATPVLNGRPLVTPVQPPKTQMWFFIYGQVVQADARSMRNILLATSLGVFLRPIRDGLSSQISVLLKHFTGSTTQRDRTALAVFTQTEIATLLKAIHLPDSTPLSVLAVELLPGGTGSDVGSPQTAAGATVALSANIASTNTAATFPFGRILRASPLTPVGPLC
ncbi:MAG TPA: hypothetical protein VGH66_08405 [Acidimicrobiales bacterium]